MATCRQHTTAFRPWLPVNVYHSGLGYLNSYCKVTARCISSMKWNGWTCIAILLILLPQAAFSQSYYGTSREVGSDYYLHVFTPDLNTCGCTGPECDCMVEILAPTIFYAGLSVCPDGSLFGIDQWGIHEIDPTSGDATLILPDPGGLPSDLLDDIACAGNGIFYTLGRVDPLPSLLYQCNVATGTIVNLGSTGFIGQWEFTKFDGEYYFPGVD